MVTVLLVIHAFVTVAMIGLILLQKSDSSGPLGIGGGGTNSLFTARGVANILTRSTAILASLFIGNCVLIGILTDREAKSDLISVSTKKKAAPKKMSETAATSKIADNSKDKKQEGAGENKAVTEQHKSTENESNVQSNAATAEGAQSNAAANTVTSSSENVVSSQKPNVAAASVASTATTTEAKKESQAAPAEKTAAGDSAALNVGTVLPETVEDSDILGDLDED
jgi:preprotein translocase subunit SecG